jgi:DNA-binding transcriptional regulator PaaX
MEPTVPKSALAFILKGLMPYTRENLMLSFKPNLFFNELEKISKYKRKTLEEAARRAREQGLIEETQNHLLCLTELGKKRALPFVAKELRDGAKLMLIFDIPEDQVIARQRLRRLLRKWGFEQVQKSVWMSGYDFGEAIREAVDELGINECVKLYECAPFSPAKTD